MATQPAVGTGPNSTAPQGAARPAAAAPKSAAGRIGNDEYQSAVLPCAQEAAVLFSAGHADAATRMLKAEIKDPVGKGNKQAWLMLFDLYQIQPNREEFDALSLLFTVKFEQSPPAWIDNAELSTDARQTPPKERKDIFVFKGGKDLAGEIEKFRTFAETHGSVRLDVTKLAAITAEDATLLAQALQALRKKNLPMWFTGVEALEKLLRAGFNEKPTASTRPYWQLMFELCILQGKNEEFEELSLEYAVAFEMSPPNWEVYVNSVSAAVKTSVAKAVAAANPAENGFPLKGVLGVASANQIGELTAHAASRSEVTIDMGKVSRIEFGYTAAFFEVVKSMQLASKRVILANLNELNAALLEAIGANRYAILVRRKSS
jgi:anti-anti-sigma regulatory factor